MSTEASIILSIATVEQEKLNAADRMINLNKLPLTRNEILSAFNNASRRIRKYITYDINLFHKYEFLFDTLLNNNKDMFVAVIKKLNDDFFRDVNMIVLVRRIGSSYNIGFCDDSDGVILTYKTLLNYNDFNVDDLVLLPEYKYEIQQYRQKKYGGAWSKPTKNE